VNRISLQRESPCPFAKGKTKCQACCGIDTTNSNNKKRGYFMAVGWSHDGSVQEQIDATVESAVQLAQSRLPEGESLTHCQECEAAIPEARRKAMPGVRCCVRCQSELEKKLKSAAPYNRRGSKDSQLK
jgi:phage/conjugal plasmid C-4 type zinc finger TraR family protein